MVHKNLTFFRRITVKQLDAKLSSQFIHVPNREANNQATHAAPHCIAKPCFQRLLRKFDYLQEKRARIAVWKPRQTDAEVLSARVAFNHF